MAVGSSALALLCLSVAVVEGGIGIGPVRAGNHDTQSIKCKSDQVLTVDFKNEHMFILKCKDFDSVCGHNINLQQEDPKNGKCVGNLTYVRALSHEITMLDTMNARPSAQIRTDCLDGKNKPKNFMSQKCHTRTIKRLMIPDFDKFNLLLGSKGALHKVGPNYELGFFPTVDKKRRRKKKESGEAAAEGDEMKRNLRNKREAEDEADKDKNKKILKKWSTKINENYIKAVYRDGDDYKVKYCWVRCDWGDGEESKRGKKRSRYSYGSGERSGGGRSNSIRTVKRIGNQGRPGQSKVQFKGQKRGYMGKPKAPSSAFAGLCFPNKATVHVENVGLVPMERLQVGDNVRVLSREGLVYSPITMFSHKDTERTAAFLKLSTRGGNVLEISAEHMLFMVDCVGRNASGYVDRYVDVMDGFFQFARNAVAGQSCVLTRRRNGLLAYDVVAAVEEVEEEGVIAPLTREGTIVVNGVLASVYAGLESQFLAQGFYYNVYKALDAYKWVGRLLGAEAEIPLGLRCINNFVKVIVPSTFGFTQLS